MPGAYTARLSVGDWSMEQGFNLVKDPRVKTSQRDLKAQLDLMIDVQNKLSEIIEAVNTSRGERVVKPGLERFPRLFFGCGVS